MEGGLEYLFGATIIEAGGLAFKDWWAHNPNEEKAAFEAFVTCGASAIAALINPAPMQKMIAKTKELGELQRKFEELGAVKPSTIKTKEDAVNRIAVLDRLIRTTYEQSKRSRENGGNAQDTEVFLKTWQECRSSRACNCFFSKITLESGKSLMTVKLTTLCRKLN